MPDLFAYTDGACSGNPGPGGWGVLMIARDGAQVVKERTLQGGEAMSDEAFRAEARAFFEGEFPEEFKFLPRRMRWSECRDWYLKLVARGWAAPAWPVAQNPQPMAQPAWLLTHTVARSR